MVRSPRVMLVTSLRDGMNLVAKEYIATRTDETGVLVLSELTGAASELVEAIAVNPYDVEGGYCSSHQRFLLGPLEVEHLLPLSQGGSSEEENLWLACARCNRYKDAQTKALDPATGAVYPLYNPRAQRWHDHFAWDASGATVRGLTPVGRATVVALRLNHEHAVAVRMNWISAGWHPPED